MKKILFCLVLLFYATSAQAATLYDLEMKADDTQPYYFAQIKDAYNNPVNLSGFTVTFSMVDSKCTTCTPKVDAQAMVVSAPISGYIEYQWQVGDTDISGEYILEVLIVNGLLRSTYPTKRQDKIIIKEHYQ